ncbi:YncE family protein [Luteimonas yindakuii]|uniref:YncE family protein n=1 Tax=Luteimonas yindakuii TaxID=2565782 RepID=A0A4Z1RE42_9GAMM|nr:YncE family protein [Luteimonas yindakuii]QCO68084.1 YncE family protein [Luteimonas yindakuii]TKS54443.1 YncE family protein [Luteimonas yindakuii]
MGRTLVLAGALLAVMPAWSGELLVGNKSADTVWRISLDDGTRRAEIATGAAPHEIAVAPGGRTAVVTNYGHQAPGNSLSVIDRDGAQTRTFDLGTHARPHGVRFSPDGQRLLVTTEASGSLLMLDAATGVLERAFDIGDGVGHMVALSRDGTVAYVSKIRAGSVVRVDLTSGGVLERPAGAGAEGIEVAPDGNVWVTNRDADTVTVHDPESLAIRATLASSGFPIRVVFTPDGRHALVTNARAATLSVFDAASRQSVSTVPLAQPGREYRQTLLGRAALPIGVIADPQRPRVYVAISGGNEVAVVDTARWEVIGRWTTGDEPDALAILPDAAD